MKTCNLKNQTLPKLFKFKDLFQKWGHNCSLKKKRKEKTQANSSLEENDFHKR
jgi:hypothetical protein